MVEAAASVVVAQIVAVQPDSLAVAAQEQEVLLAQELATVQVQKQAKPPFGSSFLASTAQQRALDSSVLVLSFLCPQKVRPHNQRSHS